MPFCGECGAEVPSGVRFCGKCGKPLGGEQSVGMYRQANSARREPTPADKTKDRIAIMGGLGACISLPFVVAFGVLLICFLIMKFACEVFNEDMGFSQSTVSAQPNSTDYVQSDAACFYESKTSSLIEFFAEISVINGYEYDGSEDVGEFVELFIDSQTKDSILVVTISGGMSRLSKHIYKFAFNKDLKSAEETRCWDDNNERTVTDGTPPIEESWKVREVKTLTTSNEAEKELRKIFLNTREAMYKELRKYPTNSNNDVVMYVRNGMKYLESGDNNRRPEDYDLAEAEFTKAILLSQNNAEAYYGRGRAYLRKGDNNQAVADYTQAIRLNPNDAISYSNRGRAYARMGNYDQAVSDFESAHRIDPNNALIKQNLEKARRREKGL